MGINKTNENIARYLETFVASPRVGQRIIADFSLDRLWALGFNMGVRTFVLSSGKRKKFESENGFKVPTRASFDMGDYCNLHCKNCYVKRENLVMTDDMLEKIMVECTEDGIYSFPVFGGEPFHPKTRGLLLESAQKHQDAEYMVCTNGTFLGENEVIDGIDVAKNIFPILSLDGLKVNNDRNRGVGVFEKISAAMDALKDRRIFYGVSTVVLRENMDEVCSDDFFRFLDSKGVRAVYMRKCISPSVDMSPQDDIESEKRFFINVSAAAKKYHVHTLGGEVRNPSRMQLGKRENHVLHFKANGIVMYGRFGSEIGDMRTQHVGEILRSERMREAVKQNYSRLYGNNQ
jgi:sulfatase maturation enzyme AslB (radical SAM superfamily)